MYVRVYIGCNFLDFSTNVVDFYNYSLSPSNVLQFIF